MTEALEASFFSRSCVLTFEVATVYFVCGREFFFAKLCNFLSR